MANLVVKYDGDVSRLKRAAAEAAQVMGAAKAAEAASARQADAAILGSAKETAKAKLEAQKAAVDEYRNLAKNSQGEERARARELLSAAKEDLATRRSELRVATDAEKAAIRETTALRQASAIQAKADIKAVAQAEREALATVVAAAKEKAAVIAATNQTPASFIPKSRRGRGGAGSAGGNEDLGDIAGGLKLAGVVTVFNKIAGTLREVLAEMRRVNAENAAKTISAAEKQERATASLANAGFQDKGAKAFYQSILEESGNSGKFSADEARAAIDEFGRTAKRGKFNIRTLQQIVQDAGSGEELKLGLTAAGQGMTSLQAKDFARDYISAGRGSSLSAAEIARLDPNSEGWLKGDDTDDAFMIIAGRTEGRTVAQVKADAALYGSLKRDSLLSQRDRTEAYSEFDSLSDASREPTQRELRKNAATVARERAVANDASAAMRFGYGIASMAGLGEYTTAGQDSVTQEERNRMRIEAEIHAEAAEQARRRQPLSH